MLALQCRQDLASVGNAFAHVFQLAVFRHQGGDLRDRLPCIAIGSDVGDHGRIGELLLKLVVSFFELFEFVVHDVWRLAVGVWLRMPAANR